MISIQTNVNSVLAQENLRVNGEFQTRTIQRLTSGYRINSSGDDAAGLAVANQFRSQTAELTQGVRNANDGISQLQIVDGGLSNISTMLDRLTTLATQSASSTFTGDRNTLNTEYQQLVTEITRQASNVGLNAGGTTNSNLSVYLGGGRGAQNSGLSTGTSAVNVDLSGPANAVDAASLKLDQTDVAGGGVNLGTITGYAAGGSGGVYTGASQDILVNFSDGATTTVHTGTNVTYATALANLNNDTVLKEHGFSFAADANGNLLASSSSAFGVYTAGAGAFAADAKITGGAVNTAQYNTGSTAAWQGDLTATGAGSEVLSVKSDTGTATATVSFAGANSMDIDVYISTINAQLKAAGSDVQAVKVQTGGAAYSIGFEGASNFSVGVTDTGLISASTGIAGANPTETFVATGADIKSSLTGDANAALTSVNNALKALGLVQGKVGAGENKLQYAINLAKSQISNFSSAEAQIRDADIASEAANLTKAQVLQQSSIAAMAQANSAPQAVLKLLQ